MWPTVSNAFLLVPCPLVIFFQPSFLSDLSPHRRSRTMMSSVRLWKRSTKKTEWKEACTNLSVRLLGLTFPTSSSVIRRLSWIRQSPNTRFQSNPVALYTAKKC
ncbi:hypothetical protein BC826DRAFT_82410 [Russula brevipes]|nr:hypothetical protein BC826DRAFT_82410 [Russula brevipes]